MRPASAFGSVSFGRRSLGVAAAPDYTSYTKAAAPLLSALVGDKYSTETVETLKAQIANHKRLRDSFPDPLKTLYANKVRVLSAKLKAALDLKKRDAEDRASKYDFAMLGKIGGVVGIFVGGALILLIVSGARRVGR